MTTTFQVLGPYEFRDSEAAPLTSDTVRLVEFALPLGPDEIVMDIGTGAGAIPLILSWKSPVKMISAVEISPKLAALAKKNAVRAGLSESIEVIEADYRDLPSIFPDGSFTVVITNPPFMKKDECRLSPDPERAAARAEVYGSMAELVSVAARLLGPGGRFFSVYPAGRLDELKRHLREKGFSIERIGSGEGGVFLIEARRLEGRGS